MSDAAPIHHSEVNAYGVVFVVSCDVCGWAKMYARSDLAFLAGNAHQNADSALMPPEPAPIPYPIIENETITRGGAGVERNRNGTRREMVYFAKDEHGLIVAFEDRGHHDAWRKDHPSGEPLQAMVYAQRSR